MITNDRQYKIIKSQTVDFISALEGLSFTHAENIHPKLIEAHKNALEFKLNNLLGDIKEYEDLKSGQTVISQVDSLEQLPLAIIKARIANQLTQSDLAKKLNIKMQQIQRYEAEKYETASLKTIKKIAEVLNIQIVADIQLKSIDVPDLLNIRNYPFRQMFQRNWFGDFFGSYNEAVKQSPKLLSELFDSAGTNSAKYSLAKRTIRKTGKFNEFALNAWYSHVILKAKEQELPTVFDKSKIDKEWLQTLAQFSAEKDGPLKAIKFVQNSGIKFVLEPVLEGTLIDGAAILSDDLRPIIAMTLRYDRLDNFWFVLFHEIAHVILHLNENLTVIFDDLDSKLEGIENEADLFALDALIPNEVWRKSLVRFSPSDETIINQAKKLKLHPSLLAGRYRRETGKYFMFTNLIGQGEVRKLFEII